MNLNRLLALDGLVPEAVCYELFSAAGEVPAELAIVEIGSFKGKSTCCLASGAQDGLGAHVWAVDPWDLEGNETGRFHFAAAETREAFSRQVNEMGLAEQITAIQGFSTEVAVGWDGPAIGLLYIDGDHKYKSVAADFAAWSNHLTPRATVIFDDLDTERNPGVRKAVDELAEAGAIEFEKRDRLAVATWLR